MSMFFGLRGMANLPVDSMKYGGMLWFVDLTVPDPYYLLPALTCATMFLTIKVLQDVTVPTYRIPFLSIFFRFPVGH